jgi:hypothetical protein
MASIRRTTTAKGEQRYTVRYRDPARRQQQRTFRRRVDAERFKNHVEASKDSGTYVDQRGGTVALSAMADRWMETRTDKAHSTRVRDRSYLNSLILPTFGTRPINTIVTSEIAAWVASLDKAPNT